MPGFNDAHLHLADAGLQKLSVDLDRSEVAGRIPRPGAEKSGEAKAGEWILGGGWDETLWPVKTLPTRWDLDEISDGHPVFLDRVDGHLAVANTRALQLAKHYAREPRSPGRPHRPQRNWRAHRHSSRHRAGRGDSRDSSSESRLPTAWN